MTDLLLALLILALFTLAAVLFRRDRDWSCEHHFRDTGPGSDDGFQVSPPRPASRGTAGAGLYIEPRELSGYVLVTAAGVELDLERSVWGIDEVCDVVDWIEALPEVAASATNHERRSA